MKLFLLLLTSTTHLKDFTEVVDVVAVVVVDVKIILLRVHLGIIHKRPSLEREVFPFFDLPGRDGDPDVVDVGHGLADLARQRILFEVDTFQSPARDHGLHIHI